MYDPYDPVHQNEGQRETPHVCEPQQFSELANKNTFSFPHSNQTDNTKSDFRLVLFIKLVTSLS